MRLNDRWLFYLCTAVAAMLVLIPSLALLYGALQSDSPGAPGREWTLDNFRTALFSRSFLSSIGSTLLLSTTVAALSTVLATLLAWITCRTDTPGRGLLETLIIVPTFLSPLVGATGWLVLGARNSGLINVYYRKLFGAEGYLINISSFGGAVWAMVLFFTPVVYLYVSGALRSMDRTLEEAAQLAGARVTQVMTGVTLRMVAPAILTGAIFAWVFSAEMFSIPGLLVGPWGIQPLAYRIFLAGRTFPPNHPLAAAASTVLVALTLLMLYAYRRITAMEGRFVTLGGKGTRPKVMPLGPWRWVAFGLAFLYVTVAVFLPYLALTIASFLPFLGAPVSRATLTLNNWRYVLGPSVMTGLKNSLLLGVTTGIVVIAVGVVIGYGVSRRKIKLANLYDYLLTAPIGIPGIAFAIGMIWAYVWTPVYGTVFILFLAYLTRYTPNSLRAVSTSLLQLSRELEDSAALAGASTRRILLDIMLPLIKPALFSSWVLTTIMVMRELSMSAILYTPRSIVISVLAWDFLESGQYGYASAVGLLQSGLVIALLLVARLIFKVRLSGGEAST